MSAKITPEHRGLAKELWSRIVTSLRQPRKGPDIIAFAIADAEERGRIAGIREAAYAGSCANGMPCCKTCLGDILALLPSEPVAP